MSPDETSSTIEFSIESRSSVRLQVKRFIDAGLGALRIAEIIGSLPDAGSQAMCLRAAPMHASHEIVVIETGLADTEALDLMIKRVCRHLEEELRLPQDGE